MEGKVIEIKDLGEFLVVVSKRGFRLLDMHNFTLSAWSFKDEQEIMTILNVVGVRKFKGEA